jgi:autotransporter translocation and assembly factor TamB
VHIAEVDLRGDINNLPASVKGFGGLSEGMSLSQSNLKAEINGTTVSFETAGHDQGPGHLHLDVSDLRRWLPESSGRLQLNADIGAKGLQYHVSGTLERAHWRDIRIDSATVGGSYRHADEHPFEVNVALAEATLGSIAFTSLQLVASGDEKARSLTISSEGEITGRLAINGAGKNGEWQGALTPTSLQTRLGVWELADPVRLTASESTKEATLASHCWLHEHARICSEDWALGADGTGAVEVTGKLALLQPLLPQNVELDGEIDTQLEVSWGPSSETRIAGRAYIDSPSITRDVGEGERATAVWDKTEAMLTVDKRGLQLELGLSRDNRNEMLIELSLPPERDGALKGLMQFDHMQLAPLAPLFPQFSHVEGDLSGSVLLTGSLKKPLAKGKLTLVGRQLSLAGNPSKLEDLNLTVVLQGDRARINGKGLLGGGILSMAGSVRQDPELILELYLKGENHTLLYPPSTQLRASENLSITLENGIVAITGDITVHEGTLQFEQLPTGGVSLSSDIVEVDYIGVPVGEKYPINTSMDIRVQIEDKFILTGTLLQTAIAGDLSLRQLPSEPLQIFGTLNTVGGEVRAYGRRLLIRRGVFNFSGPPEKPTLDFQADRQISGSNIRVGIQLSGRLEEDLNLDIYSEPAMSREDAISYLVRGRSVDADTSGDGTAMALSLAGGVVSRSALVTRLNSVPGVSDIALGADGSEEETTALEVVSRLENSADLYYSFDLD